MKRNKLMTLLAAALLFLGGQSANAVALTAVAGDHWGSNESPVQLVDGKKGTKWGNSGGGYAIIKSDLPLSPTSYVLRIANDTNTSPGRNWKTWKIYGGNFASDDEATKDAEGWNLIDAQTDVTLSTEQYKECPITVSGNDKNFYTYFMIVVEKLVSDGQYMQMDEFWFDNYTVDVRAFDEQIQKCKDFDLTGADEPLTAEYNTKLNALTESSDAAIIEKLIGELNTLQAFISDNKDKSFVAISAVGTGVWGDGHWSNLIDGNMDTKCGGGLPNDGAWLVFRANGGAAPYVYTLTTGKDTKKFPGRNWKTWKIYGANFTNVSDATRTAEGWVLLDSRENVGQDLFPAENLNTAAFSFSNFPQGLDKKYYYFKVELEAVYDGTAYQMTELEFLSKQEVEETRSGFLAEFDGFDVSALKIEDSMADTKSQFIAKMEELKTTNDVLAMSKLYNSLKELRKELLASAAYVAGDCYHAIGGNTKWGDNENHTKLVDGDVETKWGGGMPEGGSYIIFKAYEANTFKQYMLVTGNDTKNSPGRNWKTWKIYGAGGKTTDANATRDYGSWVLLDEKTNIGPDRLPADNFAPAYFSISKEWTEAYQYFKIEVESEVSDGSIQMSEFNFLSDEKFAAIRQEYVDSLTKASMALADLGESIEMPEVVKNQLIAQLTESITAKITAVATATADDLLPNSNAAVNYITVEVPKIIAANTMAQVDGVYQIGAAQQLVNFATIVNSGATDSKAVLTTDIDLAQVITNNAWTSIGNDDKPYKGTFDGQGYTIKNITYTATGKYNGLFGKLTTGAVVKNFTAEGTMTVSASVTGRAVALIGVAGDGGVLIQNINSKMNYNNQLAGAQVGGVLGGALNGNATVVDRCTYSGTLDGNDAGGSGNYGGLVGYANNNAGCYLTISNCLFDGKLVNSAATPGGCTFGGMIGYSNGAQVTIKNVLSIGTVQSAVTGMFFGAVKSNKSSINNSYYQGENVNGSASTVTMTANKVTDEQLASNEIVLKLGVAFRQDVGKDAYPTLDLSKPVVTEISEAGYATLFVDNVDLGIPEGVVASAGLVWGNLVDVQPIEGKIAAGEPVILKGEAGVYSFAPTTGAVKAERNDLKGAATDVEAAGKYVLAKPEDKAVGFYKANAGTVKAGKAYLEVPATEVKAFYFNGEEETSINSFTPALSEGEGAIYNVAGQRVSKLQKGINIVNGKKVLK